MSTNDVPGANAGNNDELAMGCWAEHADGSLILVESTEANRVIYSVFDMSRDPPFEYRDGMPETSFKRTYSWDPAGKKALNEKWTWHDKTPFPWEKIIKQGHTDGPRMPAAEHVMNAAERIVATRARHSTAAERVAEELHLRGEELDRSDFEHRMDRFFKAGESLFNRLSGAISKLPGGKNHKGGAPKR